MSSAGSTRIPGPHLPCLSPGRGGVWLEVMLTPRAGVTRVCGVLGDRLKVSVAAPPVEGRANEALIRFLADLLEVPRSSLSVTAGESSRRKRLFLAAAEISAVESRLQRLLPG